jgi:hypothetical protein
MNHRVRLLVLFAPLVASCYVYRPVARAGRLGGDVVRLTLTDSGAVSMASQLGPATEEVSGHILADSAGAYTVSVVGTRRRGGLEMDWRGEHVTVPRTLVARTEERRFSRQRTIVAGVSAILAAFVAREAIWGPGGVAGGAPPGGGPTPR